MLNKHKLQRIAIATSALMAFGTTQLIANAETLNITGTIQGPTCSLSTSTTGSEIKSFTLALPTVALSGAASAATSAAGTVFGSAATTTFSLTAAGGGSACNFAGGASGWDMSIVPSQPGFISTIGGSSTYLSNMIDGANGGTNAVVKLLGGVGTTGTNELALSDAGAYASGPTPFRALSTSSIALTAQFAQPVANTKPSSGTFSSTLTLGVNYR